MVVGAAAMAGAGALSMKNLWSNQISFVRS
jgi:hypothetical protein